VKSQITHEEINEAIIQFVRQRYNPEYLEGKEITVELTAGRSNGNSASIDIKPLNIKQYTNVFDQAMADRKSVV